MPSRIDIGHAEGCHSLSACPVLCGEILCDFPYLLAANHVPGSPRLPWKKNINQIKSCKMNMADAMYHARQ